MDEAVARAREGVAATRGPVEVREISFNLAAASTAFLGTPSLADK